MNMASVLATKGNKIVTVRPDETIRQALTVLAEHNIGVVVVVDPAGKPVGIMSERDVVRAAVRNEALFALPVSAIMTRDVVVGAPQDDLDAVSHTMTERRIRHMPVVDRGVLVGMVSLGDIVKAQRDQYRGEVDTLEIQLLDDSRGPAAPGR
jgi:CBS domain-containing protein